MLCANDAAVSAREHEHIWPTPRKSCRRWACRTASWLVCGGDLGVPQVKKYDIETWMPGGRRTAKRIRRRSSHDFQARRLNLRYRTRDGALRFVHTLNNTVIASPRILIPLLEVHQRADGSVAVPEVLQPFMGGVKVIEKR